MSFGHKSWLLPKGRAGEFNEAVMDLGATICTPRAPDCGRCPLQTQCAAHAQGRPAAYPIKPARKQTPHKNLGVLVLLNGQGQALLGQRQVDGLLGGLWEFVSDVIDDEATRPCWATAWPAPPGAWPPSKRACRLR